MSQAQIASAGAPAAARHEERVTRAGAWLAFTCMLIGGSGVAALRLSIGPFLLHPFLFVMPFLFVAMAWTRRSHLGAWLLAPLLTSVGLYFFATLPEPGGTSELIKVTAATLTMLTGVLAMETEADFRWAALGLLAASAVMAVQGLLGIQDAGALGINPLEGIGNKNAYSLYALPALLVAAYTGLATGTPRWMRFAMVVGCLLIVAAIFSSGNRSGYLGVVLVAGMVMLRRGRRLKALAVALVLGGIVFYFVTSFGASAVVERRLEQTEEGYSSDEKRVELFQAALQIGMEHPILGVTPQRLPLELARRVPTHGFVVDPHNLIGLIVGGAGFTTLAALLWLTWALWRGAPSGARVDNPWVVDALFLLRAMVVLAIMRSMFTREIIYNPGFAMGIGLCLGLCVIRSSPTSAGPRQ